MKAFELVTLLIAGIAALTGIAAVIGNLYLRRGQEVIRVDVNNRMSHTLKQLSAMRKIVAAQAADAKNPPSPEVREAMAALSTLEDLG